MLVVDASVIAPVVADAGPDGVRFRQRLHSEQVAAPDLLRVEVVSVIRRQLHFGNLDVTQAE
ncbi:MAG: VapC toxin family PIN domain ribonuclease, partial [Acidimicrobiia bacterium]|nr:VapC toxin family PIN domain ribonuclease [Acidimicrobiia bacterium]